MSDYIKREDAEDEAVFLSRSESVKKDGTISPFKINFVRERIRALPSADVEEVVHCKECKYATAMIYEDCVMCYKQDGMTIWNIDDYCSYGERKDGE